MSGQRFAFSKQRHLFPESPWFPKTEAELNGTLSTKESDPYVTASADISFILDVSAEREISIYFLPLSHHIYSFNPKQDGWEKSARPLGISLPLTRDTESRQGKPEPCRATLETWPRHLAYLLQT